MRLLLLVCALSTMLPALWATGPPRLEDYPATGIFRGTPARPVLATKDARMFRTELRRQAARGPNFAGHYTLALWGCGAGCANGAVIDARSGEVWLIPFSWDDEWKDGQIICPHGSTFDISSELLVVDGRLEPGGKAGKHYFRWHKREFSLVYFDEQCVYGYLLDLWRDGDEVVGLWSQADGQPADFPTVLVEALILNEESGALRFSIRWCESVYHFRGTLGRGVLAGHLVLPGAPEQFLKMKRDDDTWRALPRDEWRAHIRTVLARRSPRC